MYLDPIYTRERSEGSVEPFTAKSDTGRGTVFEAFPSTRAAFVGNRRRQFRNDTGQTGLVELVNRDSDGLTGEEIARTGTGVFNLLLGTVLPPRLSDEHRSLLEVGSLDHLSAAPQPSPAMRRAPGSTETAAVAWVHQSKGECPPNLERTRSGTR